MDRQRIIIFSSLGLLLLLLYYILGKGDTDYSWQEHYRQDSKDPYGTLFISTLLTLSRTNDSLIFLRDTLYHTLPEAPDQRSNYVFIGEAMYLGDRDLDQLLDFVENGNTAFISCRVLPYDLMLELYLEECDSIGWDGLYFFNDSSAQMNFNHPDLRADSAFVYPYFYRGVQDLYEWQYIDDIYFCEKEEAWVELGQLSDYYANFARVKYGDGFFYLHTTPIAFTNLYLVDNQNLTYPLNVFSHLNSGPIYWDEYSRVSAEIGRRMNNAYDRRLQSKSPLQFILHEPSLSWAWYLLLAIGLLYLIFRTKRRQRVIPVLAPNENTSLKFVSTISSLYFLRSNHKQLALQKMKLLQIFIREKYNLPARTLDQEFVHKLAVRAEIPPKDIQQILTLHHNIATASFVSENTLIQFHKLLEQFYQNCK